jgi:hypothetical protein
MSTRSQLRLFDTQAIDRVQPKQQTPIMYILEQQKLRTRQDLLKLRVAIDAAENVQNHDRELLHNIYRDIILDTNLSSQWESRKMKTMQKNFKIVRGTEEVPEMTKVLEAPWFYQWMDACLESLAWGFSLIEFGELVNGEFLHFKVGERIFPPVTIVDRDNVKPEIGIITTTPGQIKGIAFDDPLYTDYLMFVGDHRSFGFLFKAAKYILCKNNTVENWSEWAEVFGMDKRVGYTEAQGEDRRQFVKAIQNIGTNAYGVFTTRDKVEFLGTARSDAFGVYKEFLHYIDEQIAKLIFGQDVVSNNTGRVVGSVGENVANMYGDSDAMFIKHLVNRRLMPFMENLGFAWQGLEFQWDTSEKLTLIDRATVDLQIKNMGFEHSKDYINRTYGTEVEEAEIPETSPLDNVKKLKAMYE